MKRTKSPNLSMLALMLVILLGFSYLWQSAAQEGKLDYSEVRQLFVQEKVESYSVSDYTLTMKLRQPLNGRDTVQYELYDLDLFQDDLWQLIQQQEQKGLITRYDYL